MNEQTNKRTNTQTNKRTDEQTNCLNTCDLQNNNIDNLFVFLHNL